MQVKLIPGKSVDAALAAEWTALQMSNPELGSPLFSPEFTQAVAQARDNVEVALLEARGRLVGVFPFQRINACLAEPVGGYVSDFHGIVCSPGFSCCPKELLKGCGLAAWDYERLLVSQTMFAPFHDEYAESPQIDLSRGYQQYVTERRAAGSEQIKKCGNAVRRLELEIGPLRFVSHSTDLDLLGKILNWKSSQYRRTGWEDIFASWGRILVERIQATKAPGCTGALSLIFAGDQLAAGHLGMHSQRVWHYWFPAYNPELARYSPGVILLLKIAEYAAAQGIHRIDLGTGFSLYKQRLSNASVTVADGYAERLSWLWWKRVPRRKVKLFLTRSPITRPVRRAITSLGWASEARLSTSRQGHI